MVAAAIHPAIQVTHGRAQLLALLDRSRRQRVSQILALGPTPQMVGMEIAPRTFLMVTAAIHPAIQATHGWARLLALWDRFQRQRVSQVLALGLTPQMVG